MFQQIRLKLVRAIHLFFPWTFPPMRKALLYRMLGLIFLGIMSRLLPHPPNFTAINAIALFSTCSLENLSVSLLTIFSIMLLPDLVFGFHSTMIFVYLSYGLIVLMGYILNSKRSLPQANFLLISSSLLFFLITNFGVWFVGSMYPKTVNGLELCYLAAIPFLVNNLMSSLLYGNILFCWFERGPLPFLGSCKRPENGNKECSY